MISSDGRLLSKKKMMFLPSNRMVLYLNLGSLVFSAIPSCNYGSFALQGDGVIN